MEISFQFRTSSFFHRVGRLRISWVRRPSGSLVCASLGSPRSCTVRQTPNSIQVEILAKFLAIRMIKMAHCDG